LVPTPLLFVSRVNRKGARHLRLVRWGLIPSWVKDAREFATLINARAETASDKPSFRGAMRHRRCLVPADGFYEWTGGRGTKQPHFIRLNDNELFSFSWVFGVLLGAAGSEIETMAILTTGANHDMARSHDRMPVIIEAQNFAPWLDCSSGRAAGIKDLVW